MPARIAPPKQKPDLKGIKRPEIKTAPSGRKYAEGSLSDAAGVLINEAQEKEIARALATKPVFASEITVTGLSVFDARHQAALREFLGKMDTAGLAELQRDAKGKPVGWCLTRAGLATYKQDAE